MKKILVIVVLACVAVTTSYAQESHSEENDKTVKTSESGAAPGMKYNQLKKIYNYAAHGIQRTAGLTLAMTF